MALLQLVMLAYLDDGSGTPTLLIGPGVPASWLAQPLAVSGVWTRAGVVAWTWNAGSVQVTLRGRKLPVRLGSAFPPATTVDLRLAD
jgi:hypothetical protein